MRKDTLFCYGGLLWLRPISAYMVGLEGSVIFSVFSEKLVASTPLIQNCSYVKMLDTCDEHDIIHEFLTNLHNEDDIMSEFLANLHDEGGSCCAGISNDLYKERMKWMVHLVRKT